MTADSGGIDVGRSHAGSAGQTIRNATAAARQTGFTLLELLVVLAIVAIASAGVGLALQGGTQTQLEREALRLAALLESARAQSQTTGVPVRWQISADGFQFDGAAADLSGQALPQQWLDADTRASIDSPAGGYGFGGIGRRASRASLIGPGAPSAPADNPSLLLGPEPIIGPQAVTLASGSQPQMRVRIATDGVRPFAIGDAPP